MIGDTAIKTIWEMRAKIKDLERQLEETRKAKEDAPVYIHLKFSMSPWYSNNCALDFIEKLADMVDVVVKSTNIQISWAIPTKIEVVAKVSDINRALSLERYVNAWDCIHKVAVMEFVDE